MRPDILEAVEGAAGWVKAENEAVEEVPLRWAARENIASLAEAGKYPRRREFEEPAGADKWRLDGREDEEGKEGGRCQPGRAADGAR